MNKSTKHTRKEGHTMGVPTRVAIGGASGSGGKMPSTAGKGGDNKGASKNTPAGTRLQMGGKK